MENTKVCMLVMDAMRLDQFMSLYPMLAENFTIRIESSSSILPSSTPFSRNAIFSGLFPEEFCRKYPEQLSAMSDDRGSLNQFEKTFLKAIDNAIGGASGILIQFPLYFGIMGIMNSSGLVDVFANFFVTISNEITYPIFTMISGGLVNIFVPSGGGQWAVQGPIVLQSALDLGVSLPKSIMALAYGDQLTNMLQPFWALPLLGITQLKAKDILPYTIIIMLIGACIF